MSAKTPLDAKSHVTFAPTPPRVSQCHMIVSIYHVNVSICHVCFKCFKMERTTRYSQLQRWKMGDEVLCEGGKRGQEKRGRKGKWQNEIRCCKSIKGTAKVDKLAQIPP